MMLYYKQIMDTCKGVFNEVRAVDDGLMRSGHVYAIRMEGVSDNRYNTERTIKQLIADRKLFVCDESNVTRSSSGTGYGSSFENNKAFPTIGNYHGGSGCKRNKSRKPKRRNSRSNRRKTLNKSKK